MTQPCQRCLSARIELPLGKKRTCRKNETYLNSPFDKTRMNKLWLNMLTINGTDKIYWWFKNCLINQNDSPILDYLSSKHMPNIYCHAEREHFWNPRIFKVILLLLRNFIHHIGDEWQAWRIRTGWINQIGRLMDFPVKKHFHNFFPRRVQPLKVSRNIFHAWNLFPWKVLTKTVLETIMWGSDLVWNITVAVRRCTVNAWLMMDSCTTIYMSIPGWLMT